MDAVDWLESRGVEFTKKDMRAIMERIQENTDREENYGKYMKMISIDVCKQARKNRRLPACFLFATICYSGRPLASSAISIQ